MDDWVIGAHGNSSHELLDGRLTPSLRQKKAGQSVTCDQIAGPLSHGLAIVIFRQLLTSLGVVELRQIKMTSGIKIIVGEIGPVKGFWVSVILIARHSGS